MRLLGVLSPRFSRCLLVSLNASELRHFRLEGLLERTGVLIGEGVLGRQDALRPGERLLARTQTSELALKVSSEGGGVLSGESAA